MGKKRVRKMIKTNKYPQWGFNVNCRRSILFVGNVTHYSMGNVKRNTTATKFARKVIYSSYLRLIDEAKRCRTLIFFKVPKII